MNDIGKVIASLEELADIKEEEWYHGEPGAETSRVEAESLRQMIKVLEESREQLGSEEEK